ncbi:MAG TPA: phosphoenolpyruvate--protein phosphotransferase [Alphaproteobacteria bacterium]|jgi:phosphotransferase system enzyme I (PtsP)|nr:phosphoenolpyruvate--protein phosphotransferase [Alphaproteobacteria bacterium]
MEPVLQRGADWSGVRRLLKSVRDVMAATESAQARLDQVAKVIAAGMVAEVCSVYVLRAGDVLELFATEGLKHEAVHVTRLRVGEGLVGDIAAHARPLALADARSHPSFAYRPETGEEIYPSFMGVPILRGGRVIGVLVVQNRKPRHYTEEEIEALETISMVLAELVASGELVDPTELQRTEGIALLSIRLEGVRLNDGIAIGRAVLHRPRIAITRLVAEDAGAELERLEQALENLHSSLDDLLAAPDLADSGEHRDVLETYRMFAKDRGWMARIREAIGNGLTAEAAVQKVQDDTWARMSHVSDHYLRERLLDFEDLTSRLLQHLSGGGSSAPSARLPDDAVVIARSLGPAELLDYDRSKLRAVVMEEGSATAHVSIIGRALGIPVLGQVKGVLDRVDQLDPVIVDADNSQLFVRPSEDVQQAFQETLRARAARAAAYMEMRDLPAVTQDGIAVSININAGLLADLRQLDETGADGVGLYRTEIPFMVRSAFPDVTEQVRFYKKVFRLAKNRAVAFRTLDVGGDKLLSYMRHAAEENPAMGWRSIRIGLDHPVLLREQLRALIRAAARKRLDVMFPMISEVAEFDSAREILDLELERARKRGEGVPKQIRVGAMLEVPALAWQLDALLPRVDFLSIGSNDLIQFLFASDRGNPALSERYDMLSPAVLLMLRSIAERCAEASVPLGVCGEMAGRPLEAMALVGIGIRSLSMAPASVGPVKSMVRSLEVASLEPFLAALCRRADRSLRAALKAFAQDHGTAI